LFRFTDLREQRIHFGGRFDLRLGIDMQTCW